MLRSPRFVLPLLGLAALLASCAREGGQEDARAGQETAVSDTGAAAGAIAGMQGMRSEGMMDQVQDHVRMMERVSADSMRAMMAMHRQMVANMISQMNREMRDMNMSGDAAWTATIDTVRQDLIRLPEMAANELRDFFPAHRTRVMRLVDSHREMIRHMRQ